MADIKGKQKMLTVKVKNPEATLYEGEAYAITSINDKGIFDVLPQHENFICMIKNKVVIHLSEGYKKEYQIEKGVLKASENTISIFLGFEDA